MKTFQLILFITACFILNSCIFTITGYSIGRGLDKDARTYNETEPKNRYIYLKDLAEIEYREFICIVTKNDRWIQGEFKGFDDGKRRKEPLKLSEYQVINMSESSISVSQIKYIAIPYNDQSLKYDGALIGAALDFIFYFLIIAPELPDDQD